MEKRKRESSERSFGESESVSSHSEKDSEIIQPESTMESHDDDEIKQPEDSLEVETESEDLKDSVRILTEKLSSALANVSAKDDLVKQHAKVAEEAVAGWEKAENEAVALKEKLEAVDDKNKVLEDRVSHLDGALKECVRQLRQARDEQEERIQDAVTERTHDLQSSKTSLESQILEAASKSDELSQMAESVAKENVMLRHELLARCEELEIRTIERDLSTQAAETASKQMLDSIKKVAKLEAECRKLRMLAKSSASSFNDHRSNDSHSDGGERMDVSCSESWTSSSLVEKRTSSIEIDLMGDFLEMERLVALPETTTDGNGKSGPESVTEEKENFLAAEMEVLSSRNKELEEKLEKLEAEKDALESQVQSTKEVEITLRFELESIRCDKVELENQLEKLESEVKCNREVESTLRFELEAIACDKTELEDKLEKMEVEKAELQISFDIIKDKYKESQVCLQDIETKLEEIQKEMKLAHELKTEVESQIIAVDAEAKTKSAKIESLEEDMRKEKFASDELKRKCEALEEEVSFHQENAIKRENIEPKIKQEDMVTAAGKLANCQKTIASLGKQLQSLATLEDFLIDTASIPVATNGVSNSNSNSNSRSESWKVHKNESFLTRNHPESIKPNKEPSSSSSSFAAAAGSVSMTSNRGSSEKNRNGFAKVFTRSKDGIHLAI
uniref:Filament-like plant protein 1 n=1 Tax=Noccaea caerulescens TaxID=107243 RepID=A0A1J3DHK8_NOCCA